MKAISSTSKNRGAKMKYIDDLERENFIISLIGAVAVSLLIAFNFDRLFVMVARALGFDCEVRK